MHRLSRRSLFAFSAAAICRAAGRRISAVSILQDQFLINGKPTYKGRAYEALHRRKEALRWMGAAISTVSRL
jgi:hypothetical protein